MMALRHCLRTKPQASAPAPLLLCLPWHSALPQPISLLRKLSPDGVGLACCDLLPVCLLQVFFNGANVRQVDVPTQTGAFGILAAHVPTLQVLRPGLVVVHAEDGTTTKYFGEFSRRSVPVSVDEARKSTVGTRRTQWEASQKHLAAFSSRLAVVK